MNYLYNVMTKDDGFIQIRIDPKLRNQFKAAARLMGFKGMSGAIHHYIVKSVNEQRERSPLAFDEAVQEIAEAESSTIRVPVVEIEDYPKPKQNRKKKA